MHATNGPIHYSTTSANTQTKVLNRGFDGIVTLDLPGGSWHGAARRHLSSLRGGLQGGPERSLRRSHDG